MAKILDVVGKVARMEARSAEAILNSEAGQSGALPQTKPRIDQLRC